MPDQLMRHVNNVPGKWLHRLVVVLAWMTPHPADNFYYLVGHGPSYVRVINHYMNRRNSKKALTLRLMIER
jgi:hypothetical protein